MALSCTAAVRVPFFESLPCAGNTLFISSSSRLLHQTRPSSFSSASCKFACCGCSPSNVLFSAVFSNMIAASPLRLFFTCLINMPHLDSKSSSHMSPTTRLSLELDSFHSSVFDNLQGFRLHLRSFLTCETALFMSSIESNISDQLLFQPTMRLLQPWHKTHFFACVCKLLFSSVCLLLSATSEKLRCKTCDCAHSHDTQMEQQTKSRRAMITQLHDLCCASFLVCERNQ